MKTLFYYAIASGNHGFKEGEQIFPLHESKSFGEEGSVCDLFYNGSGVYQYLSDDEFNKRES